jgi:hypothetical protein
VEALARRDALLPEEQLQAALDPYAMTSPRASRHRPLPV